jgi:hypothetical protein
LKRRDGTIPQKTFTSFIECINSAKEIIKNHHCHQTVHLPPSRVVIKTRVIKQVMYFVDSIVWADNSSSPGFLFQSLLYINLTLSL